MQSRKGRDSIECVERLAVLGMNGDGIEVWFIRDSRDEWKHLVL